MGARRRRPLTFPWVRWLVPALLPMCALPSFTAQGKPRTHGRVGAVAVGGSRAKLHLSEYQKQGWQVEDGLPESQVRQIAQAADGRLLLATFSGVSIFDGQRFSRAGVQNAEGVNAAAVNAILPGLHGDLWVGTDGSGVLHQSGDLTENVSERAGLLHERIRTMMFDRAGTLWIATQNGIERLHGSALERVEGTGIIGGDLTTVFAETGLSAGEDRGMLFVTSEGLFEWSGGAVRHLEIAKEYGLPVAVYRDRQRRLWLGTANGVLQVTEEIPRRGNVLQVRRALTTHSPVTTLVGDAEGNLWVGTRHDGLWRYSGDAEAPEHWASRDGLEDETIRALFVDDEDNLWIGMLSGGLSRWRKAAFAPYGSQEGFSSSYASVTFADSWGNLWLGTWGQGLQRRRHGVTMAMPLPGMQSSTPIRAITEDRNRNVWIGTWFDGVYRYDGRSFRHYRLGIESPVNAVSALLAHRDGGLWIGTYTGLMIFPKGDPVKGAGRSLLENKLITCLLQDADGSVLVGTSEGLYRVRDGAVLPVSGMPHPYVLSLTMDSRGSVWAGPRNGGLVRVRDLQAIPFTAVGNLGNLPIYNGVEDRDGHLWLGTSRGILRVGVGEVNAAVQRADGSAQPRVNAVLFGKADGMRSSDCSGPSQPSATRMPDGTLWFATRRGFVHTTAYAESVAPPTPLVSLSGWNFSADPTAAAMRGDALQVGPGQSDVHLFYEARSLSNPGQVEFRYKLDGYDSDWTVTHVRMAHYQHLPPGRYTFQVQSRVSGTEWISPVATLEVRQKPHLYMTWYFYTAVGLLCALAAAEWYRRRIQRMRASLGMVVEERNRIARECHDTLMAGFAAVSWQMEATVKRLRNGDDPAGAVEACELARSMVLHCQAEARRIIWDLRDTDEITGVLSHALSRAIEAHYRQNSIEVALAVEGEEFALPPNSVHHLVCIGQEAISNALRHGEPSRIDLQLCFEERSVQMEVRDDGRGFEPGRSSTRDGHFGIAVMEERARKVGGDFSLKSELGRGVSIRVHVPFFPEAKLEESGRMPVQNPVRWIGI